MMKTYKVTVDDEGSTRWYNEKDQLHRENGPAVEWVDGHKEWWVNGKKLTEEEFLKATQPIKELTVAQLEELLGHRVKIVKG